MRKLHDPAPGPRHVVSMRLNTGSGPGVVPSVHPIAGYPVSLLLAAEHPNACGAINGRGSTDSLCRDPWHPDWRFGVVDCDRCLSLRPIP